MRALPVFALALLLTGCGLLGGAADLTAIDVAGRYAFSEYTVEPVAGSVDSRDLRREIGDDVTLALTEGGVARIERLRGGQVDETLATGTFTTRGQEVRVVFGDLGDLGNDLLMPRVVDFDVSGSRLRAEVFLTGVNLEELSRDYRGITRADVTLNIELREIGA